MFPCPVRLRKEFPAAMVLAALNEELLKRYKRWLSGLRYAVPVQLRYSGIIRGFCQSLGKKEVIRASPWDIRNFLIHESKRGLQYSTVHDHLVVLRSFSEFLRLGGIKGSIPIHMVRMRAAPRQPPRVVGPDTISRLVAAAPRPRDAALVELLYATGCRSRELVNIKVQDIDFESRKIRIRGKNKKARYVIFGDQAAAATRAYLGERTSGFLFRSAVLNRGWICASSRRDQWIGVINVLSHVCPPKSRKVTFRLGPRKTMSLGEAWDLFRKRTRGLTLVPPKVGPMHTATVRRILIELAVRAGVKAVAPHTIRHCFATHLLDGGADVRDIQELLGHAQLTSTQIYTHVSRQRLVETFDRCHPRGNHNYVQGKTKAREASR